MEASASVGGQIMATYYGAKVAFMYVWTTGRMRMDMQLGGDRIASIAWLILCNVLRFKLGVGAQI